ncbi:PH domain-containing protein [Serinibacter salmoneus]|uniref:Putative membrane protein n=1 Tax=Serinibacter salmoneus TaxID=556530 RepID=A0A2A9D1L9_9MICO|nr:PH domain-containing protein [Serinibacter salmoneus]PFG20608.1 putative membrane protein [Serinibacter salmoneus]
MSVRPPSGDEEGWRHVHRVTPLLNAWKVAFGIVLVAAIQGLDDLLSLRLAVLVLVGIVLGLVVIAGLFSLGFSYLAWRRLTYRVTPDSVVLRSGVVFRTERVARLTRIQSVEITQPLLGRIFGFSAVRVESAGGADANVTLAYLTQAEAQALRNEILARAAGVAVPQGEPGSPPDPAQAARGDLGGQRPPEGTTSVLSPPVVPEAGVAPEAPEHPVYSLAPGRLVLSLLLSVATVATVLGVLVGLAIGFFARVWVIVGVLPILFGSIAYLWGRFSGEFGFRVATSPDGLRVRSGLLETKAKTIPPGRVQAVALTQPLLWRRQDWWRISVTIANVSTDGEGSQSADVVLPVGTRREVLDLVRLVVPSLPESEEPALLEGLRGLDSHHGWVASPRRARWLDPIAWRRNAFLVTTPALALRTGRVFRRLELVLHERSQALHLGQGPWERRLRVVSFAAHASGTMSSSLPHLDQDVAAHLLAEQSARQRVARRSDGPELWMRQEPEPAADTAPSAAEQRLGDHGGVGPHDGDVPRAPDRDVPGPSGTMDS